MEIHVIAPQELHSQLIDAISKIQLGGQKLNPKFFGPLQQCSNPFDGFKLLRKFKKCMVAYAVVDETAVQSLSRWLIPASWLSAIFQILIKKPGGPGLIVQVSGLKESQIKTWAAGDVNLITNQNQIPTVEQLQYALREAYFAGECGHPQTIYNEPIQKDRLQWLKKHSTGNVLELGCSTGFVLHTVGGGVGVDLDSLRIEYAQRRYPDSKFISADASRLPFKDHEFDTVLIPEILEHVDFEFAKKIVKEAKRVGKKLLITLPNADKKNYRKDLVENPEHLWFPTKKLTYELVGSNAEIQTSAFEDFLLVTSQ